MKKKTAFVLLIVILVVTFCGCGGKSEDDSIIGTWTVKEYELNGERVSTNDIGEYMGADFAKIERPTLMFQKSGNVRIYYESGDKKNIL